MSRGNIPTVTFNAGLVSPLALARVDVARTRFAAEIQTNWAPRVIGPMSLRNGLGYLGTTKENLKTYPLEFVFAALDTAIIEMIGDDVTMRVRVDDEIIERESVLTTINEGDFDATGSWTLTNSGGATSSIAGGVLTLSAVALGSRAVAEQSVAIDAADENTEHGLRILVNNGPVGFQIGSASGRSDIFPPSLLGTGTHSLGFTPGVGPVFVQFTSTERRAIIVESAQIEAAGDIELPIPWDTDALEVLRFAQSGDVIYIADKGFQQRKIERRSGNSWSIVLYQPVDGPFRPNASADLLLTPTATSGNITLEASQPFFTDGLIGSLIRLFQNAQERTSDVGDEDTFTETIRVTGVGDARTFSLTIAGTWVGTLTLQRSFDSADAGFADVSTYVANTSTTFNDGFDNSIAWYRIGFKAGDYTSGTATLTLSYPGGGGAGIVRITDVTDADTALAEVLSPLSSLNGTRDWKEGDWSNKYGFPSAVRLFEGRLWWFGQDREWGSISDAFESFDIEQVGDSGPINRSIGYGPVETINWALDLQRLLLGTALSEPSIRSTAFDQPLSPTNFSVKDASTQGSANIQAIKVDNRGVYVQASKRHLYQLLYSVDDQDYSSNDLTALLPDLDSDFVQVAVQRKPDTRIHAVRDDGKVLILVMEPKEEVVCFYMVETDGFVERVAVLPGTPENKVYYYIRRIINGQTVRYVEKFSLTSECQGGEISKLADAFILYTGSATTTIGGLSHLEGRNVVVWGNGRDLGTYPVISAQIAAITEPVTQAVVGLSYQALFKSAKLAYGAQLGTALNQKKRIDHVGLILHNTHSRGVEHSGRDFDHMEPMPTTYKGQAINPNQVYADIDFPMTPTNGSWDEDARIYLRATAPRPATILGLAIGMQAIDKG